MSLNLFLFESGLFLQSITISLQFRIEIRLLFGTILAGVFILMKEVIQVVLNLLYLAKILLFQIFLTFSLLWLTRLISRFIIVLLLFVLVETFLTLLLLSFFFQKDQFGTFNHKIRSVLIRNLLILFGLILYQLLQLEKEVVLFVVIILTKTSSTLLYLLLYNIGLLSREWKTQTHTVKIRINKHLQNHPFSFILLHRNILYEQFGLNLEVYEGFNDLTNAHDKSIQKLVTQKIVIFSTASICCNFNIFRQRQRIVFVQKMHVVIIFHNLDQPHYIRTYQFLQNFILQPVVTNLLLTQTLLTQVHEGQLTILLQSEGVTPVKSMQYLDHIQLNINGQMIIIIGKDSNNQKIDYSVTQIDYALILIFNIAHVIWHIMKSGNQSQTNLILQQKSLLKKIYSQGQNLWKVLIFDNFNHKINSSLFKMKDLRQNNITLYFHLKETREQLHGVTAIYLIQPTSENIDILLQDFQDDLYSSVVIHFSSEPQTHLLSSFAKNLAKRKSNSMSKITKVEYSCLGFHTVAKNFAIMQDNNQILNLISMLKYKPIFIYGSKEEQQVSFLKERLLESTAFGKEQDLINLKQPHNIVLFFNRELDYFPVLSHGITYAGLIESLYKLTPSGHRIIKSNDAYMDIDLNDDIWTEKRNLTVSEMELSEQFNRLKVKMMSQKQKLDELNDVGQRSKKIDLHLHTTEELLKEASARQFMQYSQTQFQIYRKRVLSNELKKDINFLLETTTNSQDKIRLIIIILMYCEHIDSKEIDDFQTKVPELKKCSLFNELKNKVIKSSADVPTGMVGGGQKIFKKFAIGLLSNFKSGDKFLVTKYVEKIREFKESDLKQMGLSMSGLGEIASDIKIANIIVYCVGGACLSEEANLSKFDSRIIYSGDKMINFSDLL